MTTTRFHVGLSLLFQGPPEADYAAMLDTLYQELLATEERDGGDGIIDPDMSADLGEHRAKVDMLVDADNPLTAQLCALSALRAALHTVGVGTAGWDMEVARLAAETHVASEMLQDA